MRALLIIFSTTSSLRLRTNACGGKSEYELEEPDSSNPPSGTLREFIAAGKADEAELWVFFFFLGEISYGCGYRSIGSLKSWCLLWEDGGWAR